MEKILIGLAEKMPAPQTDFAAIVQRAAANTPVRKKINRKPLAAVLAAMLLMGSITVCGYAKKEVGMWIVFSSHSYADVGIQLQKYDYTLPEVIDGYAFDTITKGSVVPDGTGYLEAVFSPGYQPISVSYRKGEERLSISIGTMRDPYWTTYFGMEDTGADHPVRMGENSIGWIDRHRNICMILHTPKGEDPLVFMEALIRENP